MKKLLLFISLFALVIVTNAQNVAINNDASNAAASAMLDVKSTTKGMLMPRMTSAQRTTIAAPALGLLVFDTDTKTIWAYDGVNWKNLYASGGSLTLPYSQSVNTATSAFQIANQGTGASIEGTSSAQYGIGMTAKTTGVGGWGLYAFSNGDGAKSINSFADNGTAFYGENNNPANTNSLLSLLNRGAGKTGSFQLTNPASTSFNVQIAGNNLGEQLKIYQTNAANTKAALSIENSGTGESISATSTTGPGIIATSTTNYALKGVTNTATGFAGVLGENTGTAGSGVLGRSNAANSQGVYGTSTNGIGVRAASTSGTALDVNGNVKIAGGNTNPSAGAVLTSDVQGNATWQQPVVTPKIAFRTAGIADAVGTTNAIVSSVQPLITRQKVEFKSIGYDFGNNYTLYSGTTNNSSSTFTVPMTGLYHFDAALNFLYATIFDYLDIEISLMLRRNGTVSELITRGAYINSVDNTSIALSGDVTLLAGDQVFIAARQFNLSSIPSLLLDKYEQCYFNGHLVFPFGN